MRIVKRKKGRKGYFYLQHSFRKNGKVVTKERYLGLEVPENIGEIKKELGKESSNELIKKLEKIKKNFQKEWSRLPQTARKREKEEISIAFTYNTNAIEGSTITLEESREIIHDKISPNKPIADVKETEAHGKIFLQMLEKKEEIDNGIFLRWHREIFGETKKDIAGKYRDYFVRVGSYLAPDWQEVQKMMTGLVKFISKNKKMNSVELAGRTHYKFEKIHPFGDGNGRIGRLLMNQILWHSKYPMLIIEYKKRKSYYKALARDEEGFLKYFLRRYLSVHKKRV